jgi:hypothetical protein
MIGDEMNQKLGKNGELRNLKIKATKHYRNIQNKG